MNADDWAYDNNSPDYKDCARNSNRRFTLIQP